MADLYDSSHGVKAREEALHRFVRERRIRLAPESPFIGRTPRVAARIGKPVTQEELAELLGISRNWYARLEGGMAAEFSPPLLSRFCDLLLLSSSERAELTRLAMPALAPVLARDSTELYEAMSDLRRAIKRFGSASSETEIFQVAGEEARRLLPGPELIWVRQGMQVSRDEALFPHPGEKSATRLVAARADAISRFTSEQRALMDGLRQAAPMGEILPVHALRRDIARIIGLALRENDLPTQSFTLVGAHIRAPNGTGAGLVSSSTRPHDQIGLEQSLLSAIADFASLALR